VLLISGEKFPSASGGMDRGLRIRNAVKKTGVIVELDGDGVDPVTFAQARAREHGVSLPQATARTLSEFSGGDLSALAADVDWLVRCAVASNSNTPPATLAALAADADENPVSTRIAADPR
jgi:hypothetical protein